MQRCIFCNKLIIKGNKFCPACGKPVLPGTYLTKGLSKKSFSCWNCKKAFTSAEAKKFFADVGRFCCNTCGVNQNIPEEQIKLILSRPVFKALATVLSDKPIEEVKKLAIKSSR